MRAFVMLIALACALVSASTAQAERTIRVATYNIFFLHANIKPARAANIRQVIEELDADVIGLQEIKDREALELIFPPATWDLVIDDDSNDEQDLAVAVRRPLRALAMDGSPHDLDADDQDFLFSDADESRFPNRRDLLCVRVDLPEGDDLYIMVQHAKSRLGGRAVTDPRREAAAEAIINKLEEQFDERNYVLLGDFNDNGDDRSLNILETGDPDATGGMEQIDGPFLVNLTEALLANDHVSHGLGEGDIDGEELNTRRIGSRERNDSNRGNNVNTGAILFDQLLIPVRMQASYVEDSARIFNRAIARKGIDPKQTAASDHVPVYADFEFDSGSGGGVPSQPPATAAHARISAVLPNPDGVDEGHETVKIRNVGDDPVSLEDWRLRDRAQRTFRLSGELMPGMEREFTLSGLALNNDGDDLVLVDREGTVVHRVSYTKSQVRRGLEITFPQ